MFAHERKALEHIANELRSVLGDVIAGVYAFGSRVRGDHTAWSDFDSTDMDDAAQSLTNADEIFQTIATLRTTMIKELNTT